MKFATNPIEKKNAQVQLNLSPECETVCKSVNNSYEYIAPYH